MKGNIGAVNKKAIVNSSLNNLRLEVAQELDIEMVLGNNLGEIQASDSESFKVINNEYEFKSMSSINGRKEYN